MNKVTISPRRNFLKQIATLGAIASAPASLFGAMPAPQNDTGREGDGFTFLFQGDSITDGNRSRNTDWNHVMGHGYQCLVAGRLWYDFPKKGFHFFNRGISGNKVTDLAGRWQKDTLDLKPDVLSILIGINDTSAFIDGNADFTAAQYETNYRALLRQTKQQLPNVAFVLCDPFILPVGKIKDKWEQYANEVGQRQQIVKKLAAEFNAIHVEFQKVFDAALSKAPAAYWIWDGIHPMPAGHEMMSREWIHQVSKQLKFIR